MEIDTPILLKEIDLVNKYINNLKYKNRFFVDKDILGIFEKIISDFTCNIEVGKKLYRGRFRKHNCLEPYRLNEYGIPPPDILSNGRANPLGVNYLYLSEEIETVVAELRSNVGSWISLGTFIVEADIPCVYLTKGIMHDSQEVGAFYTLLEQYLTMPVDINKSPLDYLPMQYFSEFCKNEGIKGIKYLSSVKNNNYSKKYFNFVLFDESCIKCIDSSLVRVNDIIYDYTVFDHPI